MDSQVTDVNVRLDAWRVDVEKALDRCLPVQPPAGLVEAGRFSLLGNGKRVRALLVLATAHDLGGNPDFAMNGACAIEMVHAASLVLDDLPCMDDALRRRDRDTTHRAYGQSTAILCAIGLIARAFELVGDASRLSAEARSAMTVKLARAIGFPGLTGGQYDDLLITSMNKEPKELEELYMRKTGVLFSLSLEFGAMAANAEQADLDKLSAAGAKLGIAFQLIDDLLDACASCETAGKDVRKDTERTTAVSLHGASGAMQEAETLKAEARSILADVLGHGATTGLVDWMSDYVVSRVGAEAMPPTQAERLVGP